MWTLVITQYLLLLFLLLQSQQGQKVTYDNSLTTDSDLQDYNDEVKSKGCRKPITKAQFERSVLLERDDPFSDVDFCDDHIKFKSVHDRFYCKKEHFFIKATIQDLQEACNNMFVRCQNGVKRCHRSRYKVHAMYCNLTNGEQMPLCQYEATQKWGYVLFTCRWQDDIAEIIPEFIDSILE